MNHYEIIITSLESALEEERKSKKEAYLKLKDERARANSLFRLSFSRKQKIAKLEEEISLLKFANEAYRKEIQAKDELLNEAEEQIYALLGFSGTIFDNYS